MQAVRRVSSEVIVCASSAAMAMAFDAGGEERQNNYWVGDLTKKEAEDLLALGTRAGRLLDHAPWLHVCIWS